MGGVRGADAGALGGAASLPTDPDLRDVRVVLCDADDCLFGSEVPAFEASTAVTNRLLADLGLAVRYAPDELRRLAVGKNFRATALELAATHGVALDAEELERRVVEEREAVIAHLRATLAPDPEVTGALEVLRRRVALCVVSSSATRRLDACFAATGLDALLPAGRRFSAEDSLPVPTSKPDPAIYRFACARVGIEPHEGLAVEDSVSGARSAIAAGLPTLGNLLFVPEPERAERRAALRDVGVIALVSSWGEVERLLARSGHVC